MSLLRYTSITSNLGWRNFLYFDKKALAAENQLEFEKAVQCLKEGSFVIEADQLLFPRGLTKFVSGITNFVSMKDGKAVRSFKIKK